MRKPNLAPTGRNITKAERKEARSYEQGDVIRFARARHEDLQAGVWYRVVGRDLLRNTVAVRAPGGGRITYDPSRHFGVEDVFTAQRRTVAAGDKVQLRGTDRSAGLTAGQLAAVISMGRGRKITVETRTGVRKEIDLGAYKTLDHAYASTGPGAQSRTVDNVIVLQTGAHRKEVVNRASLYVAASRTRGELFLVVDDYAKVARGMDREYRKVAALDLPSGPGSGKAEPLPERFPARGKKPPRGFSLTYPPR